MSQKKRFLLRLDPKLYEVLEKWSADELRSVNSQIEYLLQEAARKAGRWKEDKRASSGGATLTQVPHQHTTKSQLEETSEDGETS
jgi:hypothetical protein